MHSTYFYTKVDLPIGSMKDISISSGLINQTNDYTFSYRFAPSAPSYISGELSVSSDSLTKRYSAYLNQIIPEAKSDFNIEIRVFKMDSSHIVLYIKPLY